MPSQTFNVNTTNGSGSGSLRDAIGLANGSNPDPAGSHTVDFAALTTGAIDFSGGDLMWLSKSITFANLSTAVTASAQTVLTLTPVTVTMSLYFTTFFSGINSIGTLVLDDANSRTVNAAISNTGSLVKNGTGTATLTAVNTYSGTTTINAGTIAIAADNNLGTGALALDGGTLSVTGTLVATRAVSVSSASSILVAASQTLSLNGVLSGAGAISTGGAGRVVLRGNNTHTGDISITAGSLRVLGGTAIGDSAAVVMSNSAAFELPNSETIGSLSGTGTNTISLGSSTLTAGGNNANTTFSGAASGTGGLVKQGTGTLTLNGNNAYTGATTVNAGTLELNGGTAIADTSAVTVGAGGRLLVSAAETIGSLAGTGAVLLNGDLEIGGNNGSTELSGAVSGIGSLVKLGTGATTLSGTNTYAGLTTVSAGTLVVNGTTVSTTTVATGATLQGNGTVGALTVQTGGTLSPGNSPGILHTGNLFVASGATTQIELNGTAAGTGYDQLDVTGTVALNGTLTATLSGTYAAGQQFRIVNNDAADAVTGTFTGLAQNATLGLNGYTLQINYAGGDGNDVVLTVLSVPFVPPVVVPPVVTPPEVITPPAPDPMRPTQGATVQTVADGSGKTLIGTFHADRFVGGNTTADTVLQNGTRHDQWTFTTNTDGSVVMAGPNGTDTLTGIERIRFDDGVIKLNADHTDIAVSGLYAAAFGRAPDEAGLAVQHRAIGAGTSMLSLAQAFLASPEAANLRGDNLSFVALLYQNVLHRAPDYAGFVFQMDALEHGVSRAQMLLSFATAAEAFGNAERQVGLFVSAPDPLLG